MKKLFTLAIVALMAVSASAQYYIGGGIGFGMDKVKPEGGESSTNTSFTIAPEFGYKLDENMSVGIQVGFTNSKEEGAWWGGTVVDELKTNMFMIAPYVRYNFFSFGNFRVAAQADLGFASGKEKGTVGANSLEEKKTAFGLNVAPVLTYNLTDKVTLLTRLNFMNLGFNQTKYKDAYTETSFGFGVDTYDTFNTGNIQVGFLYNF